MGTSLSSWEQEASWEDFGGDVYKRQGMDNLTAILTPSKTKTDTAGGKYTAKSLRLCLQVSVQVGQNEVPKPAVTAFKGIFPEMCIRDRY